VPLYPGATGLIANPGVGVEFSTNDPPDSVAKYYRDQLTALKWVLQNEVKPDANTDVQSWMKSNRILLVNITVKNGATDVMLGLHSQ
jgi:hypothetical protein